MKHKLALIALLAASPAFAGDVDLVPFGYVSHVMRTTAAATASTARSAADAPREALAPTVTRSRAATHVGSLIRGTEPVTSAAEQERPSEDVAQQAGVIGAASN